MGCVDSKLFFFTPRSSTYNYSLDTDEVDRRALNNTTQAKTITLPNGFYSLKLTKQGQNALDEAAIVADQDQQHANSAPDSIKELVSPRWTRYGGHIVEQMLEHTPLITAQYLIALAKKNGIMPRRQEIPDSAFITKENMWRLRFNGLYRLPVVAFSYPWADPFHPDRAGNLLQQVLPILETLVQTAQDETDRTSGLTGHGNEYQTVGIFLDYSCLPQAERIGDEVKIFEKSLENLWRWYAHPMTTVLMCTHDLDHIPLPTNPRPYSARGWCVCEKSMSSIAKGNNLLWDIRNYREGMTFDDMWEEMRKGGVRKPFMSPDRLDLEIRQSIENGKMFFSYNADIDVVVKLYRRAFEQAFGDIKELVPLCDGLFFMNYGWGDEDVDTLIEAFDYMRANNCCPTVPIRLGGNSFSYEQVQFEHKKI